MLEKMLVEHCSPTLSGLKTASLFSFPVDSRKDLDRILFAWNKKLNPKGVSLYFLRYCGERALIYVCRLSMLADDLQRGCVQEFLMKYGYQEFNPPYCIERLRKRLQTCPDFPHEIGLFLGYPLEDVKGFIENSGHNCKCCGYWKVYNNEFEAIKMFMKYKKCREIYTKLFENRIRSVSQLTVKVSKINNFKKRGNFKH